MSTPTKHIVQLKMAKETNRGPTKNPNKSLIGIVGPKLGIIEPPHESTKYCNNVFCNQLHPSKELGKASWIVHSFILIIIILLSLYSYLGVWGGQVVEMFNSSFHYMATIFIAFMCCTCHDHVGSILFIGFPFVRIDTRFPNHVLQALILFKVDLKLIFQRNWTCFQN